MPYIEPEEREILDPLIDALIRELRNESTSGPLNYVFTRLLHGTILLYAPRYDDYARAISVLECAKLELYTHHIRPYEDKAIDRNGDVP